MNQHFQEHLYLHQVLLQPRKNFSAFSSISAISHCTKSSMTSIPEMIPCEIGLSITTSITSDNIGTSLKSLRKSTTLCAPFLILDVKVFPKIHSWWLKEAPAVLLSDSSWVCHLVCADSLGVQNSEIPSLPTPTLQPSPDKS